MLVIIFIIVRKDLISRLNHMIMNKNHLAILNKSEKFNIYKKLKKSPLKIYYVNEKELKFYIQQLKFILMKVLEFYLHIIKMIKISQS